MSRKESFVDATSRLIPVPLTPLYLHSIRPGVLVRGKQMRVESMIFFSDFLFTHFINDRNRLV
jgi:hypothetical protein